MKGLTNSAPFYYNTSTHCMHDKSLLLAVIECSSSSPIHIYSYKSVHIFDKEREAVRVRGLIKSFHVVLPSSSSKDHAVFTFVFFLSHRHLVLGLKMWPIG